MGCVATYEEFGKVEQKAQQIEKFICRLGIIQSTVRLEYCSLRLFLMTNQLFRTTDRAFECYDLEATECKDCLANIDKSFTFLRKAFEDMFSPIQRTKISLPLSRWFYGWVIDNLEDRLENIELASDGQLALGLRNYISHVTSTKATHIENLNEKPNGL